MKNKHCMVQMILKLELFQQNILRWSKAINSDLTGIEIQSGQRSSSVGILMHNVGTAFYIKRAVINDEPLIERVVTLTGDKILNKGNRWVRLGTPVHHLLQQVDYNYDNRFPVFMGGPMMGFILPNLNVPVTKTTNCLLAPDHFEYSPPIADNLHSLLCLFRCLSCKINATTTLLVCSLWKIMKKLKNIH